MKERPVLFRLEEVRAVLDGRKTVARLVVKPQPVLNHPDSIFSNGFTFMSADGKSVKADWTSREPRPQGILQFCPYGAPGDRLWVRETWSTGESLDGNSPTQIAEMCSEANYLKPWAPIHYHADSHQVNQDTLVDFGDGWGKGRPSIHMPRWASRILLEVVSVNVERVQEIDREGAVAEGIKVHPSPYVIEPYKNYRKDGRRNFSYAPASFASLWDSINEKRGFGWDSNPWVWVVEFKWVDSN